MITPKPLQQLHFVHSCPVVLVLIDVSTLSLGQSSLSLSSVSGQLRYKKSLKVT